MDVEESSKRAKTRHDNGESSQDKHNTGEENHFVVVAQLIFTYIHIYNDVRVFVFMGLMYI